MSLIFLEGMTIIAYTAVVTTLFRYGCQLIFYKQQIWQRIIFHFSSMQRKRQLKSDFLEKQVSVFRRLVQSRHPLQILALPFLYANSRSGFSIAVGFKIV